MTVLLRRALLSLAAALLLAGVAYVVLRDGDETRLVRFSLYRPAAAQFYLDSGAMPGGSLDYAHDAKVVVPFGVPGDVGLACPQDDPENRNGYRVFANGLWFLSARPDRPPKGDQALGQAGDLPFCADFDGDGFADNGVFRDGHWYLATGKRGGEVTSEFVLGAAGDRPVVLNVDGAGNATDRRNVVYGVYRQGTWYLDRNGDGVVDATHTFGGLPQDLPLLIPRWSANAKAGIGYSLAIFRDGTWFVKPDPDGVVTLSFGFGQPGDLPGFVYQRKRSEPPVGK
jgi:hypothetical protein